MSNSNGQSVMVQGRIVWVGGDLFKGKQKTDMQTNKPIVNDQGGPVIEYGFGLAVPKSVLNEPDSIWTAMHSEANSLYPGGQLPPDFAMKYKDGDGVDHNGKSFTEREGYAGCIVLACTTRIPIKYFKHENNQNFQIAEGIKCGDYVNVQLAVKAHPAIGRGKAGLYLNPNAVQLVGYGTEIVNTPSGDAIFGAVAPTTPQGASATPVAPAGMIVPQSAVAPAPAMTAQPAAPNYNVLPQQHQPVAAPVAQPPQMAPQVTAAPAPMQQPMMAPAMPVAAPVGPAPVPQLTVAPVAVAPAIPTI